MAKLGWKWFLFYTGMIVLLGILLYFVMVETSGLTLEEMTELFDGPQPEKNSLSAVEAAYLSNADEKDKDLKQNNNGSTVQYIPVY